MRRNRETIALQNITGCSQKRLAVVVEAISWLRTKYHHSGRVKGVGTDCLCLLAEVYQRAGITGHIDVPYYPAGWHLHRDEERYVNGVLKYANEYCVPNGKLQPEPGDIVLYKFGRAHAHGVIVADWPWGIDAWVGLGVGWRDTRMILDESGKPRHARYFDPFIE